MDTHPTNKPLIGDDGELAQPDRQVNMADYEQYIEQFRPPPLRNRIIDWDLDRIVATGFGIVAIVVLIGLLCSCSVLATFGLVW